MVKNRHLSKIRAVLQQVHYDPPEDYELAVEVLDVARIKVKGNAESFARPQRVDFFLLIAVTQGRCAHMVDFEHHQATPGTWLVLRPGQLQRFDFKLPWAGQVLVVRPDFIQPSGAGRSPDELALAEALERLPPSLRPATDQHEAALQTLGQMSRDAQLTVSLQERHLLLRHQLLALLWRLCLASDAGPSAGAALSPAVRRFWRFEKLVHQNFQQERHLDFYANALACSEKTLSRACLAASGLAPKTILMGRVLLEAKRQLAHTALPIKSIAQELGFDEPTNFVKFFRQAAKCTPGEFRRQHGGEGPPKTATAQA